MNKPIILLFALIRKKFIGLVLISLLFPLSTLASPNAASKATQKAKQLYQEAVKQYHQKAYPVAIKLLEQAIKKDKKLISAYLQLATIYQQLDEPDRSIQFLNEAYPFLEPNKRADWYYDMAYLYYRLGAYPAAQNILQALPQQAASQALLEKTDTLSQHLSFALTQIQNPVTVKLRPLPDPLNQFEAQYFPVITVDQMSLIFTACTTQTEKYRENLYISHRDDQGNWTEPIPISAQINSPTSNDGTCTISANKKTLVFTSCGRTGNYGLCDLYISYYQDGTWTPPQNLGPNINSSGWQSQPSLSADGKTLYFVSERPGNYGKKDIWKSVLQANGEWSPAVNLGPPINTSGHEISPFIHPNGQTLFFASDRTPSMGGFDIYYANEVNGVWTEPVNLGYPINNHKDQVSLFVTADGKKAYYAGRKQVGNHYYNSYLYELDMPENLVAMPKSEVLKLKIIADDTNKPLDADISVYALSSDSTQHQIQVAPNDGETIVVINEGKEYLIYINKNGYLFETIQVNYPKGDRMVKSSDGTIKLKPLAIDQSKILQHIYFRFDDYHIEERSHIELDRLIKFLQANPQVHIALEGHTDYIGPDRYNCTLSRKRAKAIYDKLIEAGIDAARLTYEGYGPTRPLVPNDTAANRQLNRRVAFRITHIQTNQ